MEKKSKIETKKYSPVVLYLNDLEKIINVFDKNTIKYSIETDEFKYDNLSELINDPNRKNKMNLFINSKGYYFRIEFLKFRTEINVDLENNLTRGLFHEIDEIICKSRRYPPIIYSSKIILVHLGIIILKKYILEYFNVFIPIGVTVVYSIIYMYLIINGFYVSLFRHSTIHLIKKENDTRYFGFKKENITSFFWIVLSIILTKIVDLVWPSIFK